ncbi:MAG: XdhC family protein [Acidobacteriota bacterium]
MPSPDSNAPSALIADKVARLLEAGATAALATLIEAPANVGTKLLIEDSGDTTGGLGNEALSAAVVRQAVAFLNSKQEIRVYLVKEFAPQLFELDNAQVLFERIQPEPRLVICGAGHVGAALVNLASVLGYSSTLIDDRAEFVARERFPDPRVDLVAAENWFDAVSKAIGNGHGVSVAVVTRGHSEDEECMRALMTCNADYVGLIGSKRRTRIVLERLQTSGADENKLKRVHAPIGLDIGAVTPEEVALAIMSEIVAVRRGGDGGGSLSEWRRNK